MATLTAVPAAGARRRRRAGQLICSVVAVLLIAGCATAPRQPQAPSQPIDINKLTQWQARGRIGVSGGSAGGGSGSFEWRQNADKADVQIRGPVGIGSVHLNVEGSAADPVIRLQTGNGTTLEAQAAWDELEKRLGAPVPAGSLRFWMLGIAGPGEHRWLEPDANGAKTLEQEGWRINYQEYSDVAGGLVPVRMKATSGDARVRIVIDTWQLGPQ